LIFSLFRDDRFFRIDDGLTSKAGGFVMRYGLILQAMLLAGLACGLLALTGGAGFVERPGGATITTGSLG
jgi:hypothetical protein